MNDLALQRLTAAGWSPERNVDITPIERDYAEAGMQIPEQLQSFFSSYGFLRIQYDIQHIEPECHYFDPTGIFRIYDKNSFNNLFHDYGIDGMVYPIGSAYRDNMTIYFHSNGYYYLYMECGPLIQAGNTIDSFLNGLIGDDAHDWVYIDD